MGCNSSAFEELSINLLLLLKKKYRHVSNGRSALCLNLKNESGLRSYGFGSCNGKIKLGDAL